MLEMEIHQSEGADPPSRGLVRSGVNRDSRLPSLEAGSDRPLSGSPATESGSEQRELEALRAESTNAARRIARLEELLALAEDRNTAKSATPSPIKPAWAGILIACVIAPIVLVATLSLARSVRNPVAQSGTPVPASRSIQTQTTASERPRSAVLKSLEDLDDALAEFPPDASQAILRRASITERGCMLVWVGGLPSVVFGSQPIRPDSIATTLEKCAQAVGSLH
jgi:hypothetical protein